ALSRPGRRAEKAIERRRERGADDLIADDGIGNEHAIVDGDRDLARAESDARGELGLREETSRLLERETDRSAEAIGELAFEPLSRAEEDAWHAAFEVDSEMPAVADEKTARAVRHVEVVGDIEDLLIGLEAPAAEDGEEEVPVEVGRRVERDLHFDLLELAGKGMEARHRCLSFVSPSLTSPGRRRGGRRSPG